MDGDKGQNDVVFGEFSLATQFHASDSFLNDFADAQKWAYSQGAGWIFWNFKTEKSNMDYMSRQWCVTHIYSSSQTYLVYISGLTSKA